MTDSLAQYTRTETESKPSDLNAPSVCTATRLGTVLNVVREGDRYHFDIQVGKYPAQTLRDLGEIVAGLGDSRPWSAERNGFAAGKFVCISSAKTAYMRLNLGDEHQKWESIVNGLTDHFMQFAGDVFWRLGGPYKGTGPSIRSPHVVKHRDAGRVRLAESTYTMPRGTMWRFELTSDVGPQVAGRPRYETEVTSSDETTVRLAGNSLFPLRRYSTQMVQFRAESADKFGKRTAALSFKTVPGVSWPNGPSFDLQFKTRENRWRLWIGTILGLLGITGVTLGGSDLMKGQKEWAVGLLLIGALFVLLAGALLSRKISLPGA